MNKTNHSPEDSTHIPAFVRYSPQIGYGLTSEQVDIRVKQGQTNVPVDPPSKTTKEIIFSNTFTYFNLIFAIITALLIGVGSYRDLAFVPIIIANTLIGIIQEIRSKRTLAKLSVLSAPKATVLRDGNTRTIPVEDLVLDDLAIFSAGNQISADGIVLAGEVQVNESLITGESDEITKRPGDHLLSGSFVVSGRCQCRLEKVGTDSYAAKLTSEAKVMDTEEQSEMIRSLDRIVKVVGVLIIPISIVLFSQQYFYNNSSLKDSVTSTAAAIMGMIPEGLYLLTSVALAVSVIRLANKKVLVHDMKCIETLARVNVLCVDKTGTITETKMTVNDLVPLAPYDSSKMPALELLLGDFVLAMERDNETMNALAQRFTKGTGNYPQSTTSFSSATKYSSATFADNTYVLGAPEFVLQYQFVNYESIITSYSREGFRVLVFGIYQGTIDGKILTSPITPLGLVLLSNPIRKEAKATFHYFAKQGVTIKVISGDNPITVSKVATEAGIQNADKYVDASTLTSMSDIREAMDKYTVFGRVTPNQKRQFVQALKDDGNIVAMTGDGVNDVLALKDADCSIAMASGSEVAAQAAQLVLLESNFACMPSVVLEGRRVVNNIERSASLFLVKNIFSFLLSIFSMVLMVNYPLQPSQISLISMFTIGIPAFLLALEPNTKRISGHFIPNIMLKALPGGLTDFIAVSALVLFSFEFEVGAKDVSTASTLVLAFVGFLILFNISRPMNRWRWIVMVSMTVGLGFCSLFMRDLFQINDISPRCTMLLVLFVIASEPVFRYLGQIISALRAFSYKHRLRKAKIKEWEADSSLTEARLGPETLEESDDFTEFQLDLFNTVKPDKKQKKKVGQNIKQEY